MTIVAQPQCIQMEENKTEKAVKIATCLEHMNFCPSHSAFYRYFMSSRYPKNTCLIDFGRLQKSSINCRYSKTLDA